jgi:hypothetical protein
MSTTQSSTTYDPIFDQIYEPDYYYYYYENVNQNMVPLNGTKPIQINPIKESTAPVAVPIVTKIDVVDEREKVAPKKKKGKKLGKRMLNSQYKLENSIFSNLMKLNIRRDNVEKALAATGYTSQLDAMNWLINHSNDKILNTPSIYSSRDFILLLCPTGRLADEIDTFLKASKIKCGSNDAHNNNMLPFMKLTPFFKVDDSDVANLHRIFDLVLKYKSFKSLLKQSSSSSIISKLSESLSSLSSSSSSSSIKSSNSKTSSSDNVNVDSGLDEINIDLYASSQMILLYPDLNSENAIKDIVHEFTKLVALLQQKSIKNYQQIVPYSKQLHLTLGYKFNTEHKRSLEELAIKNINYKDSADWSIRLYSRDSRLEDRHVSFS